MSINKVILVGNLGSDPEIRTFDNGDMIATVSVATSERWTDKNTGEKKEQTEWHRVVFSNRLAEVAKQYLHKGSQVYVEGKIKTRKWQDQNGQDKYSTEIRAENLQMLGSAQQAQQTAQQGQMAQPHSQNPQGWQGQQVSYQQNSRQQSHVQNPPVQYGQNVSDNDMPF